MNSNQKELLERVLLLMKYDNKQTLTENKNTILKEQIPGSVHPLPYNWGKNTELPKVGEWLPNSDSRVQSNKLKDNFKRDKSGDGAYFIPTGGEDADGEYLQPFYGWDSKVYKDKDGYQYIKMEEWTEDPNSTNFMWGFKKTGNVKNFFLTKNGKKLKENPFEMRGKGNNQIADYGKIEAKGSDMFLDKSGKLKDPEKNLKGFLEKLDKPSADVKSEWEKKGYNSEYAKLLKAWTDYLMSKNLTELLDVYNKLVSFGKGGNTKDLPNYGKGTTTLSSIVLENEIYNRKTQSGQSAIKPEKIEGKSSYDVPGVYLNRTATDLYNAFYEDSPKESDGNEFRKWFRKKYPDIAKNPCGDGEPLSETGSYNNKWILCAAYYIPKDSKVNAYKLFLDETKPKKEVDTAMGPNLADNNSLYSENMGVTNENCIPFCFLNEEELKVFKTCVGKSNPASADWKSLEDAWFANQIENTENSKEALSTVIRLKLFACQPLKISKSNAEFLSNKIDNKIFGKITSAVGAADVRDEHRRAVEKKEEDKKQQEEFYKWVITQQRVTNIYNKQWLECTIGVKSGDECGETPYCGKKGKEFLEKVARGEIKTTSGKIVGDPYKDKSGSIKYYLPDNYDGSDMDNQWDIPCSSDFWDEWGGTIQLTAALAGMVASWMITGPLAMSSTLGLIAELSIDAAAGAYALYQSVKEKDNIGIATNSIFLALPFILDLPAADKFFNEIKYGKEAISNLNDKFKAFKASNPQYTSDQLATWLQNLSGYELATFKKVIKQSETDSYFQQVMKEAITKKSKLFANAKLGARYWIPNSTVSKLLIYVGPMAGYIFAVKNKETRDNLIRLENNRKLTVQQVVAWDAALQGLTNDQYVELNRRIKENEDYLVAQANTAEFKRVEKIKKELENTQISESDANRLLSEFDKAVDELIAKQNLSNSAPTKNDNVGSKGIEISVDDIEKYEEDGYTVRKDESTKKYYAYK